MKNYTKKTDLQISAQYCFYSKLTKSLTICTFLLIKKGNSPNINTGILADLGLAVLPELKQKKCS